MPVTANLKHLTEAALLAAGRPLSLDALQALFDPLEQPDRETLRQVLQSLGEDYRDRGIEVILSANYFNPAKPQAIADRTGARVVTVPLYSTGESGIADYERLMDAWIGRLVEAFRETEG